MILFRLVRKEDESGVSGTGHVADGVRFSDGHCALRWRTRYSSTCNYSSIEDVLHIHGHGGKTEVDFLGDWPTASAFGRGMAEYALDACENIPAQAAKSGTVVVPHYILTENAGEWAAGYRFCLIRELGPGWSEVLVKAEQDAQERHAAWLAARQEQSQ